MTPPSTGLHRSEENRVSVEALQRLVATQLDPAQLPSRVHALLDDDHMVVAASYSGTAALEEIQERMMRTDPTAALLQHVVVTAEKHWPVNDLNTEPDGQRAAAFALDLSGQHWRPEFLRRTAISLYRICVDEPFDIQIDQAPPRRAVRIYWLDQEGQRYDIGLAIWRPDGTHSLFTDPASWQPTDEQFAVMIQDWMHNNLPPQSMWTTDEIIESWLPYAASDVVSVAVGFAYGLAERLNIIRVG